jgi:thymidine phosphorylase
LVEVGAEFGLVVRTVLTDGTQPVGRGIGPALEARNVLDVLQGKPAAPEDLRQRALLLAGHILELGGAAGPGEGISLATATLESGRAWTKFQRICEAQGGMRVPRVAAHRRVITAAKSGHITSLDNRRLAKIAKLAGAPEDNAAGLELHIRLGDKVDAHQPLYTVHSESPGELAYALHYARDNTDIVGILET